MLNLEGSAAERDTRSFHMPYRIFWVIKHILVVIRPEWGSLITLFCWWPKSDCFSMAKASVGCRFWVFNDLLKILNDYRQRFRSNKLTNTIKRQVVLLCNWVYILLPYLASLSPRDMFQLLSISPYPLFQDLFILIDRKPIATIESGDCYDAV